MRQQRWPEALELHQELLYLDPDNAGYHLNKGVTLFYQPETGQFISRCLGQTLQQGTATSEVEFEDEDEELASRNGQNIKSVK